MMKLLDKIKKKKKVRIIFLFILIITIFVISFVFSNESTPFIYFNF